MKKVLWKAEGYEAFFFVLFVQQEIHTNLHYNHCYIYLVFNFKYLCLQNSYFSNLTPYHLSIGTFVSSQLNILRITCKYLHWLKMKDVTTFKAWNIVA